jgi:hypothetical protein
MASVSDAQAGATAVLWYSVDAGSWLRYSGAVTAQAGRSYRFRATSADAAGNVGLEQTSLPITVRPATEPPAESPSSPPSTEAPPDGVTAPAAGGEAEPALPTAPTPSTVSTPIFASAPITTQTPARASAGVRITSVTRRRGTLTVFGAMNARATGRVRVSVMGRIGRRTIRASKVAAVRRGHFRASFRLVGRLRSTTARVQYAGDARFRPQSAFKRA